MATVLYLAGFSEKDARAIALAAWAPDTDTRNAITGKGIAEGRHRNGVQQQNHLLDGETDPDKVRQTQLNLGAAVGKILGYMRNNEGNPSAKIALLTDPRVQTILHSFGDSYAHVKSDGSHYVPVAGHLSDGHAPDDPSRHPDAFRAYTMALFDLATGPNQAMDIRLDVIKVIDDVTTAYSEEAQKIALRNTLESHGNKDVPSMVNAAVPDCEWYEDCRNRNAGNTVNPLIRKILNGR